MEATYATFPGSGPKRVPVPGANGTTTLNQFLEAAGEKFNPEEKADYAVDGNIVTTGDAPVKDGSTVTKTSRVAGA